MGAISVLAHIPSDLRLDDRPLKASQNSLPLFKTEPNLGKLVDAFVETENGLVAHQASLIVNLPKMNGKMHERYLPERLGPDMTKQISSGAKITSINTKQNRLPIKWHAPIVDGRALYEYAVLVTSLDEEILGLAQLYRDRADCENVFDELKNQ
jgi:hypothetical protein